MVYDSTLLSLPLPKMSFVWRLIVLTIITDQYTLLCHSLNWVLIQTLIWNQPLDLKWMHVRDKYMTFTATKRDNNTSIKCTQHSQLNYNTVLAKMSRVGNTLSYSCAFGFFWKNFVFRLKEKYTKFYIITNVKTLKTI